MSDNRRSFLLKSFSASSAAWLTANWPAQVAAAEKAQAMGAFTYFNREQAATIDAMAAQIYPTTDTPGAREAQVIYFIDLALVTFAQDKQDIYAKGLAELSSRGKAFAIDREDALLQDGARSHHHGHVRLAPAWRQLPQGRLDPDRL
jgi:hypothetical protein